ncbi:MAG TPA: hypothetical protein VJI71_03070 [Candidatus Norongarragalinales archaeon]|nr:hypothetical protein [Candidatus Norongarragalinales archaeon]
MEFKPASYGKCPLPDKGKLLDRLKPGVLNRVAIRRHAIVTTALSFGIAGELEKRGFKLNGKMLETAHIARALSLRLRKVTGFEREKAILAAGELMKRQGHPELAEMVSKYYSLHEPGIIRKLKLEDVPFLMAGYMTREVETGAGKTHRIMHPERAFEILCEQQPERREFLEKEYENVKILTKWLEKNGVNLKVIARKINFELTRGDYG